MTYTVEQIGTSKPEAKHVVRIVGGDIAMSIGDVVSARWAADPNNGIHVGAQWDRIKRSPHMYRAVYDDHRMVGVLKINDWLSGDQAPFDGEQTVGTMEVLRRKLMRDRLPGRPQGIHTLAADVACDDEQQREIIDVMVEYAASRTEHEIRLALPLGSIAINSVRNHGFATTGDTGVVRLSPYVALFQQQELFVRPQVSGSNHTESALAEFERSLHV
jgi:hypothetical protein